MVRSDLVLKLIEAGVTGNQQLLVRTVEAMAADERNKQHHVLAKKLEKSLKNNQTKNTKQFLNTSFNNNDFVYEVLPSKCLGDLILSNIVTNAINEIIEEQHRTDLLRSFNLEPRNRILLTGPPGNGKTTLAEAVANELVVPLYIVRYDAIIGSYLGETASRLEKLFRSIKSHKCVLFFDEFDTIGKERGDSHDTGEIKRVVSSLLMQIDSLPSHVVIITATNHPELLDRAVWRRFQLHLCLDTPNKKQLTQWINDLRQSYDSSLGISNNILVQKLQGLSFAELEQFALDVQRRYVLSFDTNIKAIVKGRLDQWTERYITEEEQTKEE
ncbi:ATPase [Thalassobacillus devorans]|uniref:ATPase n=1 Tax=Thalassobacillus devorans TaxID=279813 RepID=A0ABQ1NZ69_9BACI|nr:ATP-binding protein [Thalassobacillus devorans]NIK28208.1 SpoVK/Ycf46/Vps4 family AAA+-type ATPase [Thalassobacillus devorans]GGC88059.1 ATPase [Thalassobacillus devorans]